MITFSQEEIAIMAMYRTDSKNNLLADLTAAVPHVTDADAAACITAILGKLATVSIQEFGRLSFTSALL